MVSPHLQDEEPSIRAVELTELVTRTQVPDLAGTESLGAHGKRTIPALDGVRGLAASLVFLVHYQAAFGYLLPDGLEALGRQFRNTGYNGVNVFFVLSGFLIYGSLIGRETPLGKFFVRRIRRIYPTYWAVLTLYLVLSVLFPMRNKVPADGAFAFIFANILLLPGVFPLTSIVTVAWTLSFEIFFYLGTGLAVHLLALRRRSTAFRFILISSLLVALVAVPPIRASAGSFAMFLPGMLLAELSAGSRATRSASWPTSLLVAAVFTVSVIFAPGLATLAASTMSDPAWSSAALPAFSFLVLAAGISALLFMVIYRQSALGRVFALKPIRYTGVISYSFYLIHGITINGIALGLRASGLSHADGPSLALFVVLLAPVYLACIGSASVLYRTVERRFSF